MGLQRVTSAVADAGPLIHLAAIGCLSLLRVVETLYVPDAVWVETVEQGRLGLTDLLELGDVQRATPSQAAVAQFVANNGLENLHSGECECLCLCKQTGVFTLLTDDLSVRQAAKRLSLPLWALWVL